MICDMCGNNFTIEHTGSGGHNRKYCYDCYPTGLTKSERATRRNDLLREKSNAYKESLGCSICGYNKCALALEWHHHKDDKLENPSDTLKRSWDAYIIETQKCQLVCSNCHREIHSKNK